MSNTRNMTTYRVSDYRSADDVANAAIESGSKVLSLCSLPGRSGSSLVGVSVLHSLDVLDRMSHGGANPMIQAMNAEDRKLND